MALNPSFVSTPRLGVGSITIGQTARATGTTANVVDVLSAVGVAAGTRILEVVIKADDNPADSTVVLWLHDGANAHPFDEIDIGDPAAGSTTVASYRTSQTYQNLILPAGWKLQASCTVTPTAGTIKVWALGGDLT